MREAVVALVRDEGRYLFIRRPPGSADAGYWCPVSGKVEPGESQAEAVVRETAEEVGLVVHALECVAVSDSTCGRYRLHWWRAERISGRAGPSPEASEVRWLDPAEVETLEPTFEKDRPLFRALLT